MSKFPYYANLARIRQQQYRDIMAARAAMYQAREQPQAVQTDSEEGRIRPDECVQQIYYIPVEAQDKPQEKTMNNECAPMTSFMLMALLVMGGVGLAVLFVLLLTATNLLVPGLGQTAAGSISAIP